MRDYFDMEGTFADDDDVVAGILMPDELYLLQGELIEALDEEHLRPFIAVDAQRSLHVESGFLDGLEQLQLLLAGGLIAFDDDGPAFQRVDVGLVLDEVLNSGLVVAGEDGVVVVHELLAYALIGLGLEELVDLDVVDEVVVLGDEDDQRNEEVDGDDQEHHDQQPDSAQHIIKKCS
jgi:hypothetical protein